MIEACEYERLHAVLAYEFERITTHVRLVGAGVDGLGEDISVFREDGTALHETRRALPLEGEWTPAAFCEHLETLELWPEPPEWDGALRFRRWAFESAALDLALRQAGHSLHDVLGLEPEPARFVNSLGLGKEPSIEPLRRRLARSPGVRFKLDAEATWPPALVDEVAATGAVDTIDFKGQYGLEVKDPEALGALYNHVLSAFLNCSARDLIARTESASVDLIFTDPPYTHDSLPAWEELADFAAHALRPGALLVAYTGSMHTLELCDPLRERLRFLSTGAIRVAGPHAQNHKLRIAFGSKPLVFFTRQDSPRFRDGDARWFDNTFFLTDLDTSSRERHLHHWQQSPDPATYYIERLTNPGDLVADPFLGSGTFALAARDLGRRLIGSETDPEAVQIAKGRLAL